jgi:hypothetical protein
MLWQIPPQWGSISLFPHYSPEGTDSEPPLPLVVQTSRVPTPQSSRVSTPPSTETDSKPPLALVVQISRVSTPPPSSETDSEPPLALEVQSCRVPTSPSSETDSEVVVQTYRVPSAPSTDALVALILRPAAPNMLRSLWEKAITKPT